MNLFAVTPYFAVLKNINFTKLWISQLCSQLTNFLLSFAVLIQVFNLTRSSTAVGLVILSFGFATVFFGFLAGVYSDRFDRRVLLTLTNLSQAIAVLFYIFLERNMTNILIVTFVYSSLNQFYLPAEAPSIPNLVKKDEILIANSYFSFTGSAALILGFALAGPMTLKFGPSSPFVAGSILLAIATLATLLLPSLKPDRAKSLPHSLSNLWNEFMVGVRHFWDTSRLHFPLVSLMAVQVVNGMLITITPAFIEKALGIVVEKGAFLVVAPLGLGILLGALMLGFEERFLTKRHLVIIGFLGMGLMVMTLSLIGRLEHKLFFYSIFSALAGIFNAHIFAPSHSILQQFALEHIRGRIYGALYVLLQISATLPTILVGFLADRFSTSAVMVGIGALLLSFGLASLPRNELLDKVIS